MMAWGKAVSYHQSYLIIRVQSNSQEEEIKIIEVEWEEEGIEIDYVHGQIKSGLVSRIEDTTGKR